MTALAARLHGIGFVGPSVASSATLAASLRDAGADANGTVAAMPQTLAARSAKRLTPQTRLAIAAAEQIAAAVPAGAGWVFGSSCGEGETLHVILEAICTKEMMVQPLRFQNAVHNAAAGQWTIAGGRTGPVTSIAAYDATVGAALLKALLQVALEGCPVGLVLYDAPLPPPLDAKRPLGASIACALALAPAAASDEAVRLRGAVGRGRATPAASAYGRALVATGNPIAHALPLLERLDGRRSEPIALELPGGSVLQLEIEEP